MGCVSFLRRFALIVLGDGAGIEAAARNTWCLPIAKNRYLAALRDDNAEEVGPLLSRTEAMNYKAEATTHKD
jgi:hypothetical protein